METGTNVSQRKGVVSHDEAEVVELRVNRELAVQYLKASVGSLANPDECAAGLLGLRAVAAAFGGLDGVALRSVCGVRGSMEQGSQLRGPGSNGTDNRLKAHWCSEEHLFPFCLTGKGAIYGWARN